MNLSKMCCICLSNANKLQNIHEFDTKTISLHEKLKYCHLGLLETLETPETLKNDLLLQMCNTCCSNLHLIYDFKRLIVKNSHKLRSYISKYYSEQKPDKTINHDTKPTNPTNSTKPTKPTKPTYICDICNKCFTQKGNLKSHKRTHTREKPYLCEVCSRSFARSGELSVHKRIHNNVKPFPCPDCGKTFRQQSTLSIHRRVHTKEKPFFCDVCQDKTFTTSHNLKTHKLIKHSGEAERHFACEVCKKSFAYLSILKTHRLVHTGERKYSCDDCGCCFTQAQHLKRHLRVHTNVRPFFCDVCKCSFTQKHHVVRHKQKVHTLEISLGCG